MGGCIPRDGSRVAAVDVVSEKGHGGHGLGCDTTSRMKKIYICMFCHPTLCDIVL